MVGKLHVQRVWVVLLLMFSIVLGGCAGAGVTAGPSIQQQIETLMKEGQQLYAAKNYDGAVAKFGEVVAKDAKYWQAYVGIARSYIAKGSWPEAIGNAKKAFELV